MAKTFNYGAGIWATKTGSSMAYNDQNDNYKPLPFSVTRDSIATRVNKQGLVEVVGKDKLRIDYTDSTKGVALLEPARTNLINYSEAISNATVKSGTFTDNFAISPDGSQNATKLTATNTDPYFYQSVAFTAGDYTASLWVKGIGGAIGKEFRFAISNETHSSNKYEIPSEWTRFEFTATITTGTFSTGLEITDPAVSGDEVLVWGWQVEAGSYATSYIPTSGSAVPRAADVANGAGNSEVFNDSEGVFFANISQDNDGFNTISISDGGTSDRVTIAYQNNTIKSILVYNNTVKQLESTNYPQNLFHKVAIKYTASNVSLIINGFELLTTSKGAFADSLTTLEFAQGNGGNNFYGKTKEVGYYDAVLTDAELEALTSYTSFTNMANELNLTIK